MLRSHPNSEVHTSPYPCISSFCIFLRDICCIMNMPHNLYFHFSLQLPNDFNYIVDGDTESENRKEFRGNTAVSLIQAPEHTGGKHTHNTQTHCHPCEGLVFRATLPQEKRPRSENPGISLPDGHQVPCLLAEAAISLPVTSQLLLHDTPCEALQNIHSVWNLERKGSFEFQALSLSPLGNYTGQSNPPVPEGAQYPEIQLQ